jgi:hypothetical protein
VLLEGVRSADPSSSSGITGVMASSAISEALRVATVGGLAASEDLWAAKALASLPGSSCFRRRVNSACLWAGSAAKAASQAFDAAAPLAPMARQAFSASAGTSKGVALRPSFALAAASSSAPSGSPCALEVPAFFGAP